MTQLPGMDSLLRSIFPPGEPGGVALVKKGGQVLLRQAHGLANVEMGVPLVPESVMKIGSVTKQVTAVAVLMLAERGKLALEDPIETFLPGYPTHGHRITIEHLLTHTSGIKSYTSLPEWPAKFSKDYTVEEMIDEFKYKPMDFAPGTRWYYNNSAYFLLGAIIAKISGLTYEEFLQKEIFDPLGMKHTYGNTGQAIIPQRAAGYMKGKNGISNAMYISMTQPGGAGVLSSTVDDLAIWDESLTSAALVSRASLEHAWTSYRLADGSSTHYGFGWGLETLEGQAWIGHGGGIPGFVCYILRVPAEELFVTVLSNVIGLGPSPETIAFKLARMACGRPVPEPKPFQAPLEALERIAGKYVDMDGDESAIRLVDGRLLWGEAQGEDGGETEMVSDTALILRSMPLCVVQFPLDPDGKVTGFTMTNQYGRVFLTATRKED